MTKLRILRAFRAYRAGQVLDVPGGIADSLIRNGIAVEDKQQELETAAVERRAETADATPRRRGTRAVPKPHTPDAPSR